jgi:hypothetical protein
MKLNSKSLAIGLVVTALAVPGCGPAGTVTAPPGTPGQGATPATAGPLRPTASATSPRSAGELVVTTVDDSGPGSLRQALLHAKAGDTIIFDASVFPPDSPQTINLGSGLPELVQGNLTIDASDAGVVLDGTGITSRESVGLSIASNNNAVLGLQIVGFSKAGIQLQSGAQHNTIGGDRDQGSGPVGRGNLIRGLGTFGIGLWGADTAFNTIQGNLIGTDLTGTAGAGALSSAIYSEEANHNTLADNIIGGYQSFGLEICCASQGHNTIHGNAIGSDPAGNAVLTGGAGTGIVIRQSGLNTIGPDNVIAHNGATGIAISGGDSAGNQITQNSIHDNGGTGDAQVALGIGLWEGGNQDLAAPHLLDFNLETGELTGLACAGCTVEVFSDNGEEGALYEGALNTGADGVFVLNKGAPFSGPRLTATSTDANGNTSQFSVPTPNTLAQRVALQIGNDLPRTPIHPERSADLADNHLGGGWELEPVLELGAKRASFSINSVEWDSVDWSRPEFQIDPALDAYVTALADNGVKLTVTMSFWDKANHPTGWTEAPGYSRFRTDEEIDRYLEFVTFVVRHFKDRVEYYELWNEPDNQGFPVQYIRVPDYVNLVERVVPVIRAEYPGAKIVVGSVSDLQYTQDYLLDILRSGEIMPLVDVVAWHPFYGASPAFGYDPQYGDPSAYYYKYPSIVDEIMNTAETSGFHGEYYVDEMGWATDEIAAPNQPYVYSLAVAAKYYARGVVMHLGMGINTEAGAMTPAFVTPYATVQNLATIMAGAEVGELSVDFESEAPDIRSYVFSLPDGDWLIALWSDGAAVDFDPGVTSTVTVHEGGNRSATGIDVLHGYLQPLDTEEQGPDLVIPGLLIKDYPILLRIAAPEG